jgi:hypothetical protein
MRKPDLPKCAHLTFLCWAGRVLKQLPRRSISANWALAWKAAPRLRTLVPEARSASVSQFPRWSPPDTTLPLSCDVDIVCLRSRR